MESKYIQLQKKLNYNFKDESLLLSALTHSSFINDHNLDKNSSYQRLEFLGDAVLELVISEYLFKNFKYATEGMLSSKRSRIVNGRVLCELSEKLQLEKNIRYGRGELNRKHSSIRADVCEAIIGAIFLDSNYDTIKRIILNIFEDIILNHEDVNENFKGILNQKVQTNSSKIEYRVIKEEGPDHDKTFYTNLFFKGEFISSGMGKTKKLSEQDAAKNALKILDKWQRLI